MKITKFQEAVYAVVSRIPKGKTMTYAQVATAIGNPKAVRAVGNALNKNPYAEAIPGSSSREPSPGPFVPCHRVIRSDGSIGGFASGPVAKRRLLRAEGVIQ